MEIEVVRLKLRYKMGTCNDYYKVSLLKYYIIFNTKWPKRSVLNMIYQITQTFGIKYDMIW